MEGMVQDIKRFIEQNQDQLISISDDIWSFAELGLVEHKSAAIQGQYLRAHGFSIEMGLGGMETAFVAQWTCSEAAGNSDLPASKPVIAFLGEYDALPGVSNKPVPVKEPVQSGASGHGCGHNLLGVASMGAAVALKQAMELSGQPGTVRYYGCPAEETSFGKMWMVKDGVFDDVDVALTWHPGNTNSTNNSTSLADLVYKFDFHGKSAHAAGDPWNGRSALDGVELMHAGIERMREHMRPENRVHYVITNGGGAPNVVPDYSQTFFDIRAYSLEELDRMYSWVHDIGQGAAMMTQTRFVPIFLGAAADVIPNTAITSVFHEVMTELGAPEWTDSELEFASKMQESLGPEALQNSLWRLGEKAVLLGQTKICDAIFPNDKTIAQGKGSTDVGDVSWVVPTGQFSTACYVLGAPGHSWAITSCSGMSIGHKGMIFAAKILGLTGARFLTDQGLREKAKEEWESRLGGNVYKTPVPSGIEKPPSPWEH